MNSTTSTPSAAIPLAPELHAILLSLAPWLAPLAQTIHSFSSQAPSPQSTHQFELDLAVAARRLARAALENALNAVKPAQPVLADADLRVEGLRFRPRFKTSTTIDSLFGPLRVWRLLYESRDGGPCLFPLPHQLGIVADRVTPALASHVGQLVAGHTQREALDVLARQHGVAWSATTLRKVSAAVAGLVEPLRQQAQASQVIDWLRQAGRGRGEHPPVLAVGRDGVTLDKRGEHYEVAGVGTLSVYDRKGRRMGTVYLGFMPEKNQAELSRQLTGLLKEVLQRWKGNLPQLAYVADGGAVETTYFQEQLRGLRSPRTGEVLMWQRVLDYYRAAGYVSRLAEARFGVGRGGQWPRRMRGILKQAGGITRVLQSASALRNQQKLTAERAEEFRQAHNYLWRRRKGMDYAGYQRRGIPLGSGVTEAACKVVVKQRLKRSGMGWSQEGGQVILCLRSICLSRSWNRVWSAHLAEGIKIKFGGCQTSLPPRGAQAA